ncbi:MAG TPA: hypothetical protein VJ697_05810 [Nitrososphaeraceae archaeon]|nr:hypothetical protein [Nitrososphaeraceae archaeon]
MSSSIVDKEDEDEIKRYLIDKDSHSTIIAVFEGDYVRFAKELINGKLGEEKIVSQEEFEKLVKQNGWIKQEDE